MGGDEIVAEWLGDMDADRVRTESVTNRFSSTHYRCRTALIFNNDASYEAFVGAYYSSVIQFAQNSAVIWPKSHLKFEFVDLYEIGYKTHTSHIYLQLQCINHY